MSNSEHPLFVLGYPSLSPADRSFIDSYRQAHDEIYVDVVRPHFTLVFGCEGVPEQNFCDHVSHVTKCLCQVPFVCRYAMLGVDHASPTGHVFLTPDEGFSGLSVIHDKLYTGVLETHHRLDIPFTPHIAIGTVPSLNEAKNLCDTLNRDGLEIHGHVEQLTISVLERNKIRDLQHYSLARQ